MTGNDGSSTVSLVWLTHKHIKWNERAAKGGWLWYSKAKCEAKALYYKTLLNQFK